MNVNTNLPGLLRGEDSDDPDVEIPIEVQTKFYYKNVLDSKEQPVPVKIVSQL